MWTSKGALYRWLVGEGAATPALDPPYGYAREDQEHVWTRRDGQILQAFLVARGLPATEDLQLWAYGEVTAWADTHPSVGAVPAPPAPPAPMYLPILSGDVISLLIPQHFGGASWRDVVNAQPDPQRRARLFAGFLYPGQRLKIPGELLASYDNFRGLEDYSTALQSDGKVAE